MNRLIFGGAILALVATSTVAVAQTAAPSAVDTVVNIPWGDWLYNGATTFIALLTAAVAWGLRLLPARILAVIQTAQVDQILFKAIDYAINKTAGASKGKTMNIDVGNEVLEKALQFVVDNAPKWLISWSGGEAGIREKIIARLDLDANAAIK